MSEAKFALPFMYVDALQYARSRFEQHPFWVRTDGSPLRNDIPVIAADLMSDVSYAYLARITELEALLAEAREVVNQVLTAYQRMAIAALGDAEFYETDPSVLRAVALMEKVEAFL